MWNIFRVNSNDNGIVLMCLLLTVKIFVVNFKQVNAVWYNPFRNNVHLFQGLKWRRILMYSYLYSYLVVFPIPRWQFTLTTCNFIALTLDLQTINNVIDGGAQVQQIVKTECLETFTESPQLEISFSWVITTLLFLLRFREPSIRIVK